VRKRETLAGMAFAAPWILGFAAFTVYPVAVSLYYSFTDYSLFNRPMFVGVTTYRDILTDPLFYKSLTNTLYMTVIATPLYLAVSLALAMLLNMKLKGMSVYRTIFYIPSIVPQVAASILWIWIFNARYGALNLALKALGVYQPNWLADALYTKPAFMIMGLWGSGSIIIIFLAALQDIPRSLHEAAKIDGAGVFSRFFYITLPWLSPTILFQLVIGLISGFQIFTPAWILGQSQGGIANTVFGGPETSGMFYATYLFYYGFFFFKMGHASAMAWILFLVSALITWLVFKTSRRWVSYAGE